MRLISIYKCFVTLGLGVLGCGALLDREDSAQRSAPEPGLMQPEAARSVAPSGSGPSGCVESGRTLWGPESDILSLALARTQSSLFLSTASLADPTPALLASALASDLPPLEPLPWDNSGLLLVGGALVPGGPSTAAFPLEAQAASATEAGVYWLAGSSDAPESSLWFHEYGESVSEPVATLGLSATDLHAGGNTVWAAGSGFVSAYDATSGAVSDLGVAADGRFAGFSSDGPVFGRRIRNRQGGVPYRYEVWLYAPPGEEPTRLWAAPLGTRPERVWTADGTTFATGYTFFGNGPSRSVIVRVAGGSSQTLICLPADLQFGGTLPVAFGQNIAAIVSPVRDSRERSLVVFSLD